MALLSLPVFGQWQQSKGQQGDSGILIDQLTPGHAAIDLANTSRLIMILTASRRIFLIILTLVSGWGFMGGKVWGQISTQDFGTGTGSHTSQTGSATFIPNPSPSPGTTWARAGASATSATINLVTASNPFGTTGAYLRGIASTSAVVAKFSPMVGYTGSTEFYTKFKVLFGDASAGNTATSGEWNFYQGAGNMYNDATDFAGAQVFTGLKFSYGTGGALTLSYRGGGSWTNSNLSTSTFSSATIYTIEIIGNNKSSGTISYTYNGNAQTVAVQKFDLIINGTLVGNDLSEAQLPANTLINSNTFTGINSIANVANIFVDDVVVYNSVPNIIVSNFPTLSLSPETLSGFTYLQGSGPSGAQTYTLNGTNLIGYPGNITIAGNSNFEVSDDNITFSLSIIVPFTTSTLAGTTIYVRLKAGLSASPYAELIANSGGGATTRNVSCSGIVTLSDAALVVISQVYGGGGNAGAPYTNDFIELYNRGTTAVSLNGWSVQYASATGTGWASTALTNVTLAPGQYYLVQEASGGAIGSPLPVSDVTGIINMSGTAGKVALVYNTTLLSGSCPTGVNIIDKVGYGASNCYEGDGPTASPGNTTSVFRAAGGCQDTDHNIYDFATSAPAPRNSGTTISTCPLSPLLTVYNSPLNGFTYIVGNGPSGVQSFRLSGKYLSGSGNITVTGTSNYWVSLDGITFSSFITVPYSSGTLSWTRIFVQLNSGLAIGNYNESITNAGGGATTLSVTCNGSVTLACPYGMPLYENFNYTASTQLTTSGATCWTAHVPGSNPITVSPSSITYACYQSSGIGNEVTLATSGEDDNIIFPKQTSGTVYASFLVNVSSATTAGDYFLHLGQQNIGTTIYRGRVFVKNDGSGNLAFGTSQSSTTVNYSAFTYALNTTYLIVLKFNIVDGSSNDNCAIMINPLLSSTEPFTGWLANTDASNSDLTDVGSIALRQGSASSAPALKLDGIRVSTNWADIATPTPTPAITAADETSPVCFSANAQTTSLTYSAAIGNPISYRIDWDAAANAAGLADQGTTTFSFVDGGGILTGIVVTANTPGGTTYSGVLTLKNITGCTGTQVIKVTVNAIPTVAVTPPAEIICSGGSVTLTASGASTYSWSPTTGLNQSTGPVVIASPASTTNYIVTGTTNSCSGSAAVTVDVMSVPVIDLVAFPSQCEGTKPTFTASPAGYYYEFFLNGVSQGPPSETNTYTPLSNLSNGDKVCVTAYPIPPLAFDGTHDEKVWATPLATSAGGPATSGFDPSRLDAIYMHSIPDYLVGFLAGNLIDGGNNDRLLMFIDCQANGYNTLSSWTSRSNAPYWSMENLNSGIVFDAGFTPEYILGINRTGGIVYFNLYNMTTNIDNYIGNTYDTPLFGFTANSNTGDFSKGFEFAIPMSALGNPTGSIKVFSMIVDRPTAQGESVDPTYLSNQFLTRANSGEGNYTDVAVNFGAAAPNPVSMPLSSGGCSSQACLIIGNQWTGATNSNWALPGNWCTGILPSASTDVIIPNVANQPEITSATQSDCNNLEIHSGATLTIQSDATSSGSLIVNGVFSGTGNVIYNRYLETDRYYITSPPVNNSFSLNRSTIEFKNGGYNFAPYIEADNLGWNYVASIPTSLNPGQGYLLKLLTGNTVQYTGAVNSDVTVPIANTPTAAVYENGWNAIGNPYTSALKITGDNGFITQNIAKLESNYNAVYLWYQTGSYTGSEQYYRVINNSGYYSGKEYGGPITEDYVQAGQGFLINSGIQGSGTVTFNHGTSGMQIHSTGTTLKKTQSSWPGITLLATSNGQTRSTIVAFNEKMTAGLDPSYDAGLLSVSAFNLYTHLVAGDNQTDFTIQCLPDTMYDSLAVPLGIDLPQAGTVTFKAEGIILPEGIYPVIEDRLLQQSRPLETENDSLVVELTEATRGIGRFYLHFGRSAIHTGYNHPKEAPKLTARFAGHKITLYGIPEKGSRARLYDINGSWMGGEFQLTEANQNEIPVAGLSPGIYLLRIENTKARQTIKITVINN